MSICFIHPSILTTHPSISLSFIHLTPSIYPSIHSYIHPFMGPSIHPWVHPSVHLLFIYSSIHPSIYLSNNPSIPRPNFLCVSKIYLRYLSNKQLNTVRYYFKKKQMKKNIKQERGTIFVRESQQTGIVE